MSRQIMYHHDNGNRCACRTYKQEWNDEKLGYGVITDAL